MFYFEIFFSASTSFFLLNSFILRCQRTVFPNHKNGPSGHPSHLGAKLMVVYLSNVTKRKVFNRTEFRFRALLSCSARLSVKSGRNGPVWTFSSSRPRAVLYTYICVEGERYTAETHRLRRRRRKREERRGRRLCGLAFQLGPPKSLESKCD